MIQEGQDASAAVDASDIAAIERATLQAVAPRRIATVEGWLVPIDPGPIGRARSAVPLAHDAGASVAALDAIGHLYAGQGLPPAFRIADVEGLRPVQHALADRGFAAEQPTWVQVAPVAAMRAVTAQAPAELSAQPGPGWADVFLGPGFDPAEGAGRVAALTRADGSWFASVRESGEVVAVGVAAFGHGWVSVHGMRTAQAWRGRGFAARVLAAIAQAAAARGIARAFLQVEEGNGPARALYRRAGFRPAWRYRYWRR